MLNWAVAKYSPTKKNVDAWIRRHTDPTIRICSHGSCYTGPVAFSKLYFGKIWFLSRGTGRKRPMRMTKILRQIFSGVLYPVVSTVDTSAPFFDFTTYTPYLAPISALWLHLRGSCWSCAMSLPQSAFTAMASECALTSKRRRMPDCGRLAPRHKVTPVRHWS